MNVHENARKDEKLRLVMWSEINVNDNKKVIVRQDVKNLQHFGCRPHQSLLR